jgi:hypothetical protein
MAFTFLKLKPKPSAAPARPRPSVAAMPKVMVGSVGAPEQQAPASYVGDAARRADFKKLRRPSTATETRVGDTAMAWLISLPKELRPTQCCMAYPHVVNHLAGWWDSPEALASYFEDLLHSPRKHRAGFPAPIKAEIEALFVQARATGLVPRR